MANFEDLKGKVLTDVKQVSDDQINFTCNNGIKYKMYHSQDCCETVTIEDINGTLSDLIGEEILLAEERSSQKETNFGSETWTFYTIRTKKVSIDIRWYGESNGYYSEEVDFAVDKENDEFTTW